MSCNTENKTVMSSLFITLCRQSPHIRLYSIHIGPRVNTNHLCKQRLLTGPVRWAMSPTCTRAQCLHKSPPGGGSDVVIYPPLQVAHAPAHSCRLSARIPERDCSLIRVMAEMTHSNSTRDNWRTYCHGNEWYILPSPLSLSLQRNHPLTNWCFTFAVP